MAYPITVTTDTTAENPSNKKLRQTLNLGTLAFFTKGTADCNRHAGIPTSALTLDRLIFPADNLWREKKLTFKIGG
jgi:hypothetical protein